MNKLETAFELPLDAIKQMIEIIEYMFLQSAYHLIKLQNLQNDLVNEQNFDENKVSQLNSNRILFDVFCF